MASCQAILHYIMGHYLDSLVEVDCQLVPWTLLVKRLVHKVDFVSSWTCLAIDRTVARTCALRVVWEQMMDTIAARSSQRGSLHRKEAIVWVVCASPWILGFVLFAQRHFVQGIMLSAMGGRWAACLRTLSQQTEANQ